MNYRCTCKKKKKNKSNKQTNGLLVDFIQLSYSYLDIFANPDKLKISTNINCLIMLLTTALFNIIFLFDEIYDKAYLYDDEIYH